MREGTIALLCAIVVCGCRTHPDGTVQHTSTSILFAGCGQKMAWTVDGQNGTYRGEVNDGKPYGQGIWVKNTEDGKEAVKYEGEWHHGQWYGQGTRTHYCGRHWWGGRKVTWQYVGEWEYGWFRQGTYTDPEGKKYVVEWKGGRRNGQGTLARLDGTTYVGEWKNWVFKQGTETKPDGTTRTGLWDGWEHYLGPATNAPAVR
jgi:hypothetical protein